MSRRFFASALVAGVAFTGLAAPGAMAAPQALSCKTSAGDTGGWAECTGSGTWRVVSQCSLENDKFTTWITTSKKTRQYAVDCTWDMEAVRVEIK